MSELIFYNKLLIDIKQRIRQAQTKAILSANSEMIFMYWDIGKMLVEKQKMAGWGAAVIPNLSKDIHNELPEIKGFSERNIGYMIRFAKEYDTVILQQAVAKLPYQALLAGIPWGHHILLIEKIKELPVRFWYMEQTAANGWNRETLAAMIYPNAIGLRHNT
jgi:predicted nuclease of restriction endonuclease-like (RecB) superfamily